jgi:biopolymer transport protein TolR
MKYGIEVCLIALSSGIFAPAIAAQAPALQPGISVELVPTHNASPMPDADSDDALIVAITANGSVYLGVHPISLPELSAKIRSTPFRRGHALYIKADARTPYATVLEVLEATRTGGLIPQVLLTSQSASPGSGSITPPQGFGVSLGSAFPSGTVATVVDLLPSVEERPVVKINNDQISWSELESALRRHFHNGDDQLVLLRADVRLPFSPIVKAMDSCRAAGGKVYLAEPRL